MQTESNSGTLTRPPKAFLRAHLPNQQRTSVEIVAGVRLRDALLKPLRRRNLECESCEVTRLTDDVPIPWDTDMSEIPVEEVCVRVTDKTPIMTHISHQVRFSNLYEKNNLFIFVFYFLQFIRKTFFTLAFCECCRRLLFTGLYCNQCNYRFHQRCCKKVPALCNQINMDNYYSDPMHGVVGEGKAAGEAFGFQGM